MTGEAVWQKVGWWTRDTINEALDDLVREGDAVVIDDRLRYSQRVFRLREHDSVVPIR